MYDKTQHHEIKTRQKTTEGVWSELIKADQNVRILWKDEQAEIYRWTGDDCTTGSIWKRQQKAREQQAAFEWLPDEHKKQATAKACVETTIGAGKEFCEIDRDSENIVFPCLNGYIQVRVEGGKACFAWLRAFREAEMTHVIPVQIDQAHGTEYQPRADLSGSRFWDDYLSQSLADDEIRYIQTFFGYSFLNHSKEQKGLFMLGNGGEGKSTIVNLVSRLHRKIIPVDMKKIEGFGLATATKASLIFVDDAPAKWDAVPQLKSLLSAGLMSIDHKHNAMEEDRVFAKMVVCGNETPYVGDSSNGWARRWMLSKWSRPVAPENVDQQIEADIVSRELRLVLDWVLVGLKRYIEDGLPTMAQAPESSRQLFEEMVSVNNSAASWALSSEAVKDDAAYTPKKDAYEHYRQWFIEAKGSDKGIKNPEQFFKSLAQFMPALKFLNHKPSRRGERPQCVGICVPNLRNLGGSDEHTIVHDIADEDKETWETNIVSLPVKTGMGGRF